MTKEGDSRLNFRHDEKGNPRLFFFLSPSEGEGGFLNFATAIIDPGKSRNKNDPPLKL